MNVYLNKMTQKNFSDTTENSQDFYCLSSNMVNRDVAESGYLTFAELVKILKIDEQTHSYLTATFGLNELSSDSVLEKLENDKKHWEKHNINELSINYQLCCILAVLKNGTLNYQFDSLGFFQKIARLDEISDERREELEIKSLEPAAKSFEKIYLDYQNRLAFSD